MDSVYAVLVDRVTMSSEYDIDIWNRARSLYFRDLWEYGAKWLVMGYLREEDS